MTTTPKLDPLSDGQGFRVRIRFGRDRRAWVRIPSIDPEFAAQRARELAELGAALTEVPTDLARSFLEQAGEANGREIAAVRASVERTRGAPARARKSEEIARERWTVRDLGEAWTKGDLARDFPDQIKRRRTAEGDAALLTKHVYPVIGSKLARAVTLDDCERVMKHVPRGRAANTRRNIALTLARLFTLAVYPLRIRETSPIPKGFLPKPGKTRALNFVYPSEDAKLIACVEVPLDRRLLYGILVREGLRADEALLLRWSDIDLQHGAIRLDENKTDDPRAWALDPSVSRALAAYHESSKPERNALVFPGIDKANLAMWLRRHLKAAGVTRAELFETTDARQRLRAHDLRGSFVTIALASGRTETWVADRTGHRSSQMIARYRRAARFAEETRLGVWAPLDIALSGER